MPDQLLPTAGATKKKKLTGAEVIKTIAGATLFLVLGAFLWRVSQQNIAMLRGSEESTKVSEDISFVTYRREGITYLVFVNKEQTAMSMINYTADSLRLVEYNEYTQAMIDDGEEDPRLLGNWHAFKDSTFTTYLLGTPLDKPQEDPGP